MDFRENCIEWLEGDAMVTLSLNRRKWIKYLRAKRENGEKEIEIIAENPDGSICAKIPLSWISIRKPKRATANQLETLARNWQRQQE